jgi:hypothetical protein
VIPPQLCGGFTDTGTPASHALTDTSIHKGNGAGLARNSASSGVEFELLSVAFLGADVVKVIAPGSRDSYDGKNIRGVLVM